MQEFELLFQLLVVHVVLDFMLQPDIMAQAKCRHSKHHERGNRDFPAWYYWLGAHSTAHGGGVYLITGSVGLGMLEILLHGVIDYLKCERVTTLAQDQALHVACKIGYVAFLIYL